MCRTPNNVRTQIDHLEKGVMSNNRRKNARPGKTYVSAGPLDQPDGELYGGGRYGADRLVCKVTRNGNGGLGKGGGIHMTG